ncbi:MAG: nitrite/sulfite reductase [Rhodospirillaceae bacterium]
MYSYDSIDRKIVSERIAQFRGQVERRLAGDLTEDEFRPLRLMNGLYLQLHAYMLRVAIPYGTLSSKQMRALAGISRKFDKGYGHFTTRQNIQFNWPKLEDTPDILADLAKVDMHAIQTSGNCIRNITTDPLAGVAADELEDPRPWAEIIRQWSTFHPEFSFLPRKFKIALTGALEDRAAIRFHDIGLQIRKNEEGDIGFEVFVGGGQGRTPVIAKSIRSFLPEGDLLPYLEAILRVYNLQGRRDNLYKARIKILLDAMGPEAFTAAVEKEWQTTRDHTPNLPNEEILRIKAAFSPPKYERPAPSAKSDDALRRDGVPEGFFNWRRWNCIAHRERGYRAVIISLKPPGGIPGDASARQMEIIASLADSFSFGEIRVTHEQNLVLTDVRELDLYPLWKLLDAAGLGTGNASLATDIIACPGLDYCNLANARSIPISQQISERLTEEKLHLTGPFSIKISGCINACGHHHVADIGILGVDKKGEELYQIMLGGNPGNNAAIASILGPAISSDKVVESVESIIDTYLANRQTKETFSQTLGRLGTEIFREALYECH